MLPTRLKRIPLMLLMLPDLLKSLTTIRMKTPKLRKQKLSKMPLMKNNQNRIKSNHLVNL
jgi:hypothetical protein